MNVLKLFSSRGLLSTAYNHYLDSFVDSATNREAAVTIADIEIRKEYGAVIVLAGNSCLDWRIEFPDDLSFSRFLLDWS